MRFFEALGGESFGHCQKPVFAGKNQETRSGGAIISLTWVPRAVSSLPQLPLGMPLSLLALSRPSNRFASATIL